MKLIDGEALIEDFKSRLADCNDWIENAKDKETKIRASAVKTFIAEVILTIDNAPTIKDRSLEISQKSIELGRKVGQLEGKLERPQGEFSRKDLESWLYQIAMNNIGTDFETSVVEIIHRLDGFERFVSEQKGGAE